MNGQLAQFGSRMIGPVSDVILSQFADQFRQKLMQPSTDAEATIESEKPALNASILLWVSAKKLLSSLWDKPDSPSPDVNKEKRMSSIWRWLYRK